ncbi:hypothetical protein LZ318_30815 [Saccharopolyspora indica]|nr:hypothetical protein [Saccharopolyspora indica]MDA3644375.1 hypothetical protein [Saccharopolyspora indica]
MWNEIEPFLAFIVVIAAFMALFKFPALLNAIIARIEGRGGKSDDS